MLDLNGLPSFAAHEHWGSINSIGMLPEGFRGDVVAGALPTRRTGLLDVLVDPYFTGCLLAAGDDPNELARRAGYENLAAYAQAAPERALDALRPALRRQQLVGTYQCLRRGMLALYGIDIDSADAEAIRHLDTLIAERYVNIFGWYRAAMQSQGLSMLLRPVHPVYYVREHTATSAAEERAFTETIMRIDPLLDLWRPTSPHRPGLVAMAGIEPVDAASWHAFIAALFDLAAARGTTGIKQLQAYSRTLEFLPREDSEVVWGNDLTPSQVRVFQDWVLHACCAQAHERGWVHQVHVGTHNLPLSNPLPLAGLAGRYPRMKIVQLHCWPYLQEAGWLAKYLPNVYIDTCWQPILSPSFFRQSLAGWLTYVPTHKLMCSHDATSVEMAAGSLLFVREILAETLAEAGRPLGLNSVDLRRIAADMLHNNAVYIYARGEELA